MKLEIKVGDVIVSGYTGKSYRVEEITNTMLTVYDFDGKGRTYLNASGVTQKTFYKYEED